MNYGFLCDDAIKQNESELEQIKTEISVSLWSVFLKVYFAENLITIELTEIGLT